MRLVDVDVTCHLERTLDGSPEELRSWAKNAAMNRDDHISADKHYIGIFAIIVQTDSTISRTISRPSETIDLPEHVVLEILVSVVSHIPFCSGWRNRRCYWAY